MKYQTLDGIIYDIDTFSEEEKRLFHVMYNFSLTAKSCTWMAEPESYRREIIDRAQTTLKENWQEYPLYKISIDLLGRVSIRTGEAKQPETPYPDPLLEE